MEGASRHFYSAQRFEIFGKFVNSCTTWSSVSEIMFFCF